MSSFFAVYIPYTNMRAVFQQNLKIFFQNFVLWNPVSSMCRVMVGYCRPNIRM